MCKKQSYDYLIKILIIWDSGVGKTWLLVKFTEYNFKQNHISTIEK